MPSIGSDLEKAKLADLKWEALKARGWVLPYDYVIVTVLVISVVTTFFWCVFGAPVVLDFIAVILLDILVCLLWIVSLVFRCSCFVLETQADINLMPESAARIVAGYFSVKPK